MKTVPPTLAHASVPRFASGIYPSTDAGKAWIRSHAGIRASVDRIVQSGVEIFALTGSGVFESSNAGKNWFLLPGLPDGFAPTSLAMVSTPQATTVVAGSGNTTGQHALYRYQASDLKWVALNPSATSFPADAISVAIDPADSNHILVGGNGGRVYRTNDGGATTWSSAQICTTAYTVVDNVAFAGANGSAYAACATGAATGGNAIFKSTDGGTMWINVSAGAGGIPTTSSIYDFEPATNGSFAVVGGPAGTVGLLSMELATKRRIPAQTGQSPRMGFSTRCSSC